eukprot:gene6507-356_t
MPAGTSGRRAARLPWEGEGGWDRPADPADPVADPLLFRRLSARACWPIDVAYSVMCNEREGRGGPGDGAEFWPIPNRSHEAFFDMVIARLPTATAQWGRPPEKRAGDRGDLIEVALGLMAARGHYVSLAGEI